VASSIIETTMKGVITGDIINSSTLGKTGLKALTRTIKETTAALHPQGAVKVDFYRGDSFQVIVEQPEHVIQVAILLRAALKSQSRQPWDARLAVGIGEVSHLDKKVSLSNGEAFVLSGHGLDDIGKKRLVVKTPWEQLNASLDISTLFVDDIITGWTPNQAAVAYIALRDNPQQKEIAKLLQTSQQNVSKLLTKAKASLVRQYMNYYAGLIGQAIAQP